MARRVTGLQRQIYSLYKRSLEMVRSKPIDKRPAFYKYVVHQFRHPSLGGGLKRKDVQSIEYLLRKGEKQLESYSSSGVKNVVLPQDTEDWPLGWIAKGGKAEKKR
ncbi:Sdh6p [Sporobolomyces koalae]|uniref:Sdh6p n=1 Tax=Sporobolomyces koalae TaxID=500713 RepID=UPI00317BC65C